MYIEYLALIIPIVFSLVTFLFYKKKLVWFEMLIPIVSSLILISAWSTIERMNMTNDYEFLNYNIERVEYYEEWDEYIHQTCTRTVSCGEDCTTTETYDCSYVDHHSEYYQAITYSGMDISISREMYLKYRKLWENSSFTDMHRDYYRTDGDKYYSVWNNNIDRSLTFTKIHRYENKTQAAYSNFEFEDISKEDADTLGLFHYPVYESTWDEDYLLGYEDPIFEKRLRFFNGFNGNKNQITTWILIFKDKPIETVFLQESYWKGGNKNEAVICISIDENEAIQWSKSFSWTERTDFIYDYENFFKPESNLSNYKTKETFTNLSYIIDKSWERKEFSDFDYINIPLPESHVYLIFIFTFLVTIGTLIYGVKNDITY